MLSDIIVAGQTVEIEAVKENNEGNENAEKQESQELQEVKRTYRTKVFDVLSEEQLEIMMPIERGKVILLPVDAQFNLCFYTEKGLFQCRARVLDRYKSNNIYIVVMEVISNLRKQQRREYFRLDCSLAIEFRALEKAEIAAVAEERFYLLKGLPLRQGVVADISGGGVRFIAGCTFETGTLIYCTYTLHGKNKEKQYHLIGRVLLSRELEGKPGEYENRIQYINMDVDDREEIIRYIFEEERKQQHKKNR